jgi:hypothetical protein
MTIYALAEPYVREDLIRDLFVQDYQAEYARLFYLMAQLYESAGEEAFIHIMADYPNNEVVSAQLLKLDDAQLSTGMLGDLNMGAIHVATNFRI